MDQPSRRAPSGVVAFLLTDIEGSTRLWQQHPQEMRALIQRHDAILTEAIQANGGEVLTERGEGDSFFAVFGRASEALAAARDAQRALHAEAWPPTAPIRVRMAINTGEAAGDFRGMAANRSGRLRQLAAGGEILVSQSTQVLVRDELPAGVALVDRGMRRLRDVESPEHVYEARVAGIPLRTATTARPSVRTDLLRRYAPVLAAMLAALIIGTAALAKYLPGRTATGSGHPQTPGPAARGPVPLASRTIITVAGGGTDMATGTSRAKDVALSGPAGIAVTADGSIVYIADTGHDLVLQLKGGVLAVAAGGGSEAPSGQLGTEVRLDRPTGLALDRSGNLYIADTGDNRVLEMTPQGSISVLAGNGSRGTPRVDMPASQASFDAPTAVAVTSPGYDQAGSGTQIFFPVILDSGSGSLWVVADAGLDHLDYNVGVASGDITKVPDLAGTAPTFCAGLDTLFAIDSGGSRILSVGPLLAHLRVLSPGSLQLRQPRGCAVDSADRLYIADTGNDVLRLYDPAAGRFTKIAGNGVQGYAGDSRQAGAAELSLPSALAVDARGDVFIADTGNNVIREIVAP